jgi:uncharacterized protein (DUF305 family)
MKMNLHGLQMPIAPSSAARQYREGRHHFARRIVLWLGVWLLAIAPAFANAPAPTPAQSRYETFFMEEMIDHHAMAVQMATMCEQKAVHPELRELCTNIKTSQSQEIAEMQTWLQDWYGVSYQPQMTQGSMQQMERLAALAPEAFEVEFLKRMIRHHWKAVVSASQCTERAYHAELVSLCEDIVMTQTAEIDLMRTWLCEWYALCDYGPKADANDDS